ncbi:MAG: CBS domain-containing protein [bacterium]
MELEKVESKEITHDQENNEEESLRIPLVRDLMSTDLFTLSTDDNLKTLEDMMKWRAIRHIPVVDEEKRVVGLVTHRDLLKYSISGFASVAEDEKDALNRSIPVSSIMKTNIQTVPPELTLQDAAKLMLKYKFGCLPIVENEKLVGIITEADFLKFFVERDVFSE